MEQSLDLHCWVENKSQKKNEDKTVLNSHNVHWDDDFYEVWGFQIEKVGQSLLKNL